MKIHMQKEPFKTFLETTCRGEQSKPPLSHRVARDYASRLRRIERVLSIDSDKADLSEAGVARLEARLKSTAAEAQMSGARPPLAHLAAERVKGGARTSERGRPGWRHAGNVWGHGHSKMPERTARPSARRPSMERPRERTRSSSLGEPTGSLGTFSRDKDT
jgi:hypothetical protein